MSSRFLDPKLISVVTVTVEMKKINLPISCMYVSPPFTSHFFFTIYFVFVGSFVRSVEVSPC